METFLIVSGIGIVVIILWVVIRHRIAIKHRRCPICGAPILPFANGDTYGYYCTECSWKSEFDEYGNLI